MNRLILLAGLISCVSFADTLTLRNGRTINGSYLGGDSRQIRMAVGDKIENYSIADVQRVEFGSLATPPAAAPSTSATVPEGRALRTDRSPAAGTPGYEIPAGTNLTVRMIDAVNSQTDSVGQTYRASLDEPIMVNGEVIVQRGADVLAKLVDDKKSGAVSGQTVLTLDLVSITVNGREIPIATGEVTRSGAAKGTRTAKAATGLGALGAVIGGIAGGGKGAAIGAVSGVGAGTAASAVTKGDVKVPSETRLTFTLEQPLRI